jgi:hypothetical protein
MARLDEYAATYLLDRQQEVWRYEITCKQLCPQLYRVNRL